MCAAVPHTRLIADANEAWPAADLALNLEANVLIRDSGFSQDLSARLERMIERSCKRIEPEQLGPATALQVLRSFLAFHFARRYPGWASSLPRHVPRLLPLLASRLRPAYANRHAGKE